MDADPGPLPGEPIGWRSIVRGAGWTSAGKVVGDLFAFLLFIVLSRRFGEEGLGLYSMAIAVTGVGLVVADFGLNALAIREIARRPDSSRQTLGAVVLARLLLGGAALVVLACALPLLPLSSEGRAVFLLVGAYQIGLPLADGFAATFLARDAPGKAALLQVALRVMLTAAAWTAAHSGAGLVGTVLTLPAVTALLAAVGWRWSSSSFGPLALRGVRTECVRLLRAARPFFASNLLFQIGARADVICLGFLSGAAAAGFYNAAYRTVHVVMFAASTISLSFYPAVSRAFDHDRAALRRVYDGVLASAILVGVPAAVGAWCVAPEIVHVLYGSGFDASVEVLRWLAPLFAVGALRGVLEIFMLSCNAERDRVQLQAWVAALSVTGNLALIPWFGFRAAAGMALLCESSLVVGFLFRLGPHVGRPSIRRALALASGGAAALAVALTVLPERPLAVSLVVGVLIYAGAILVATRFRLLRIRH